jgi:hypothetical protein
LVAVTVMMWSRGWATPARRSAATAVTSAFSISRGGRYSCRIMLITPSGVSRDRNRSNASDE